ncbi:MAG: antitoxin [Candidatus Micrarchaeia archaeon]
MPEDTTVITIRVPKRVKLAMERAKVNVSTEVRNYLEAKARSIELYTMLPEIFKRARRRRVSGDSAAMIRKDRDSR